MKKRLKLLSVLLGVALIFSLVSGCASDPQKGTPPAAAPSPNGTPNAPSDDVITIKFGTAEQSNMAPGMTSAWVAEEINKRSNGHIVVEHYGQSVLGNDAELMQQGLDGTLPIFAVGTSAFSQYTDLLDCVQLPFLLTSYDAEYTAMQSDEFMELIHQVEQDLDIVYLGNGENGLRHFATVGKPIETAADLSGLKIRIAPSNVLQSAMGLLGANPVSLAYTEVFSALQNKIIDAEEINISSVGSQKHYEVVKYVSEIGMYPFPATYWMGGDFYRSLSETDFNLIKSVFDEGTYKCFYETLPDVEDAFRKECEDGGVIFNTITDKSEFQEIVSVLYDDYAARDPRIDAFIKMAQELE